MAKCICGAEYEPTDEGILAHQKTHLPESEPILKFFTYNHLPDKLRLISQPFGDLAALVMQLPRNEERSFALRKLLEAKDAAVRAAL